VFVILKLIVCDAPCAPCIDGDAGVKNLMVLLVQQGPLVLPTLMLLPMKMLLMKKASVCGCTCTHTKSVDCWIWTAHALMIFKISSQQKTPLLFLMGAC